MNKLLVVLTVPALVSATLAGPASARPVAATLTMSATGTSSQTASTQPTIGSSLAFGGCGYKPGVGVSVKVESPTAIAFFGSVANGDGCFSTAQSTVYTADDAGTYQASAYQSSRRQADATLTFSVAP